MPKKPNFFVKVLMLLGYYISRPFVLLGQVIFDFFKNLDYRRIGSKIAKFIGTILHWIIFDLILPKKYRDISKKEIYRIIFKADTPAGKKFDIWLLVLIGLNLIVLMLDSFEAVHSNMRWVLKGLEGLFTILFTLEYYLRIYCLNRPWKYVFSFYGIIDFLSIFPAYLSLLIPATQTLTVLRVLRALRIFRIFNMKRFLQESFLLLNAMRRSMTKILIFMLFVFITAIILGAIIYMFEEGKNPNINSIPTAIYWAVVTITTVGYGDISPVTPAGQFISMIVMLLGYSVIAVPTGIVVGETINEHRRSSKSEKDVNSEMNINIDIPEEFDEYEDNEQVPVPTESPERFCSHCGHYESDPNARFCRYCGTKLTKAQPNGWIQGFFIGGKADDITGE